MPKKSKPAHGLAKPAEKEVKDIVKKMITADKEPKQNISPVNAQEITSTVYSNDLTGISQGDTATTRDGDKIRLLHLNLRAYFERKTTATSRLHLRVIVFRWKPDNAVDAPTLAKLLDYGATYPNFSPYVRELSERAKFDILMDRQYVQPVPGLGGGDCVVINKNIKLRNKPCYFNDTALTGKNHIYLFAFSNVTTGTNTTSAYIYPTLTWTE